MLIWYNQRTVFSLGLSILQNVILWWRKRGSKASIFGVPYFQTTLFCQANLSHKHNQTWQFKLISQLKQGIPRIIQESCVYRNKLMAILTKVVNGHPTSLDVLGKEAVKIWDAILGLLQASLGLDWVQNGLWKLTQAMDYGRHGFIMIYRYL